jgi:hypothetical protein
LESFLAGACVLWAVYRHTQDSEPNSPRLALS